MGRPTEERKDGKIILRMSADLRENVEKQAEKKGMNISEYVRELLEMQKAVDRTTVISIRIANEIADWLGKDWTAREIIEDAYNVGLLDLREFKKACAERKMDEQLAVNRMVQLIRED